MKKSIAGIYAMAVCFICMVVSAISITIALYNVVEITNPAFTMSSYHYDPHQDNERFLEYKLRNVPKEYSNPYKGMSPEELTAARERSFQTELESERRGGLQSLFQCLIILIVLALIFWVHWRLGKKAKRDAGAASG